MSRLIDADDIKYTSYVNGDSTVSKEEIDRMPTAYNPEEISNTVKELLAGNWVDCDKVLEVLGMSFSECFSMFDFSRTAEWWSIVGKTEEERAREGQKVTTCFRLKRGEDLKFYDDGKDMYARL